MSDLQLAAEMKTVIENIYTGIDLAKPAHVGLRLSIDIGGAETITLVPNMTDTLEITVFMEELPPLESMFHLAPHEDGTPESHLNELGLISPRIATAWEIKSEELLGTDLL